MSNREITKSSFPSVMKEDLEKEMPKAEETSKGPMRIDVVAKRPGFFRNMRMKPGQVFQLSSMKQLGSWMELADPKAEAERKKEMKAKKAGK